MNAFELFNEHGKTCGVMSGQAHGANDIPIEVLTSGEPHVSVIYLRCTRELKRRFIARAARDMISHNDLAINALTNYLDACDECDKEPHQ